MLLVHTTSNLDGINDNDLKYSVKSLCLFCKLCITHNLDIFWHFNKSNGRFHQKTALLFSYTGYLVCTSHQTHLNSFPYSFT